MMQFNIDDPEVKQDINIRRIAMLLRWFAELRDKDGFKKFRRISGIPFAILGGRIAFYTSNGYDSFFIGAVIGYIVYSVIVVCLLMVFKYYADKMISKLADKYTIERNKFMRTQFEKLGFKTARDIYPAELVYDGQRIVIVQTYKVSCYELDVHYYYRLGDDYGSIVISHEPVKIDSELNNRNILGIRDFDMMLKVEWNNEVKARTYLSSTKVLDLLKNIEDMENFVDKKIYINRNIASLSLHIGTLSELSCSHFPDIASIIYTAEWYISKTCEYLEKSDKYYHIVKK